MTDEKKPDEKAAKPKTPKVPVCAWPRCKTTVSMFDFVPIVGENTGRIYACKAHREKIAITKGVLGAGALAAFHEGMDRTAPGLREKIGNAWLAVREAIDAAKSKNEPAE